MKTYITEAQLNNIINTLNRLLTPELLCKLQVMKKKFGVEFYHDRQTNVNLFWRMLRKEIDDLPISNIFKQRLVDDHIWEGKRNSNDAVFEYMDAMGIREDYLYLANVVHTKELENFIEFDIVRAYHLPKIQIVDLIRMYPDFKKYFSLYTKKYADKEALAYTRRIIKNISGLYGGLSNEGKYRRGKIFEQYIHSVNMDFDTLHNLIHKPTDI